MAFMSVRTVLVINSCAKAQPTLASNIPQAVGSGLCKKAS